jgi:triacylglycerol esterase/lipase EstA (alpha/beta hydrolase family)
VVESVSKGARPARGRLARRWAIAASAAIAAACTAPAQAAPAAYSAAPAQAAPLYAPLNRAGPPITISKAALNSSLKCEPSVLHARVEPVLLNPGTGATAEQNFGTTWEPALTKLGIPWCAYTPPFHTLGDIQVSGEYLVHAIRTMHQLARRRIAIVGHSQGGMSMRWALRFWPDTRRMVDDVIGFSGTNHGTTVGGFGNCASGCPPADWQQGANANFIKALNSYTETFRGISYTEIYTHTDEVVKPADNNADASAALHTGSGKITNVATQDICPGDIYEHLLIGTYDPVAYAIAVDALTHAGPADPARISRSVCSQLVMPGVSPTNPANLLELLAVLPGQLAVAVSGFNLVGAPEVRSEPPLACYVFAGCPSSRHARPR